jgi:hypothetical protein
MTFDKICGRSVRTISVCALLAIVLVLCAVPGNLSHAQGRFLREEWILPDFYPRGFDGFGKIVEISPKRVVVDDAAWNFSRHVKFATPTQPDAFRDAFKVGDTVAYLLNTNREIISLWFIEFHKPLRQK